MKYWREALEHLRTGRIQAIADLVLETSFLSFVLLVFFSHKASNMALFLLGLSWVIRRLAAPSFLPPTPLRLPLLFFLFSMLLSALHSEVNLHSLQQLFSAVPKILVIFFGSLEYLRESRRHQRLFWAGTFVILIIGTDGLAQLLLGQDLVRGVELWRGRVRAHFPSPTFFEYPLPFLPFALALLEQSREWGKKVLLVLAATAFAASSILSQTRSVWIALSLVVLFFALFSRHKVPYLVLIGFALLTLAALPVARGKQRLFSIGDFVSEQRYQRMLAWQISYRMFLSRPLLGKGPDFFDRYKRNAELQKPYLSSSLYERVKEGGPGMVFPIYHPHSIYLEVLASQGLLGMATFTSILIVLIVCLYLRRRGPPLPLLATSAALLSFLVCGAAGTSFYHYWSYSIFWLLAGIGMSLKGENEIEG